MSQNTKGLSGLANLGNTCYINTCMQILSHTTILNKALNELDYGSLIENHKDSDNIKQFDIVILNEWNSLRLLLWKNNCTISPNRWISTVQQISRQKDLELFSGFIQNVKEIRIDDDQDSLWMSVDIGTGGSCHVGYRSCFYRSIPLGKIKNPKEIEMEFKEKKKLFDPKKVYKDEPNPTKL